MGSWFPVARGACSGAGRDYRASPRQASVPRSLRRIESERTKAGRRTDARRASAGGGRRRDDIKMV